jgi:hypothetical protein
MPPRGPASVVTGAYLARETAIMTSRPADRVPGSFTVDARLPACGFDAAA